MAANPGGVRPLFTRIAKYPRRWGNFALDWRTGWDSNPRYGFPYTRFPSERLQPLGHLSVRMSWLHARPFSSVKHRRAVVLPGCRRSESIILAGFGSGPARCIVP